MRKFLTTWERIINERKIKVINDDTPVQEIDIEVFKQFHEEIAKIRQSRE